MSSPDPQLLQEYLADGSQTAFAEIVRRHIDFVYTVALRHTHGNTSLAEDVTQTVFIALARKARTLRGRLVLGGWLYRTTQFAAIDAVRGEARRHAREKESHDMQTLSAADVTPTADPGQIRRLLDLAIGELKELDRDAIVLRFFHGHSFAEVGARLCVSEGAARMRVDRSLEKLRDLVERRGVRSTSIALGTVLAGQSLVAAPAGLAGTVTAMALSAPALTGLAAFMSLTKLQVGAAATIAVLGVAGYVALSHPHSPPPPAASPVPTQAAVASTPAPAAKPVTPAVAASRSTPVATPTPTLTLVPAATSAVQNSGDAPQIVLQDMLGPNNLYHDDLMGFSATLPDGWKVSSARRWGPKNHENTASLEPPWPVTARPSMYYRDYNEGQPPPPPDQAEARLRDMAQRKEESRVAGGTSDYKNVPESFSFTDVNGRPSLSYFATFTRGGEVMTEYFVRVLGQQGYVMFFTTGKLDEVKTIMPQVQQMAGSVTIR